MKNILIIAYYYPPRGGAGVQRTAKFASYLSRFGYNVSVLTVKEESTGLVDRSIREGLEENIKVYRTDISEPMLLDRIVSLSRKAPAPESDNKIDVVQRKTGISDKFKRQARNLAKKGILNIYNTIYVPDDKRGWIDYAVEEGKKIIQQDGIDVIFTTSAPYTCHMIGSKLAETSNIKWIADFRDPWASNPFVDNNFIVQSIYNRMEKRVIQRANGVISVSKPIIDDFIKRYPNKNKDEFHIIPNGYDEEDFKNLNIMASDSNERFTLLYNGTLYGNRSPLNILQSIDNLIKKGKISRDRVKLKFVGQIGNEHRTSIDEFRSLYPEILETRDYVPHKESINELCGANALILIIDEGPGSEGIYTGKIFEYIRTGKTILGIVPQGVARDLILETKTGYVAMPSKQKEIEDIIYASYKDYERGSSSILPEWAEIEKYSRENLTKKLMSIINSLK